MNDYSYIDLNSLTDKAINEMIGYFVKKERINQNKTQDELAKLAGISRSTLSLLERGENISLSTLIQVLRMLDLLYVLSYFKTEKKISPVDYAKMQQQERERARKNKTLNDNVNKNDILGW
jgi:transcriptional regulator with XRE-family HTH domain